MKNKLCVCGSGEKQKDCCGFCIEVKDFIKNEDGSITASDSYWISLKEIILDLLEEDQVSLENATEMLYEKNIFDAFSIFDHLSKKYPECYQILYNLGYVYLKFGKEQEAYDIFEKIYDKHPDFMYTKRMLVDRYLRQGHSNKIPELFDNKFYLKLLYPEKKVFHITDALPFHLALGNYYLYIREIDSALIYFNFVKKISPGHYPADLVRQAKIAKKSNDFDHYMRLQAYLLNKIG